MAQLNPLKAMATSNNNIIIGTRAPTTNAPDVAVIFQTVAQVCLPKAAEALLIEKLERQKLELEEQIKKLRTELTKSSTEVATSSSSSGESSRSTSTAFPKIPMPSSSPFCKLPSILKDIVGTGLDTPDLAYLCGQSRVFRTSCTLQMLERRQVSTELLPHVFNAAPEKVKAYLNTLSLSQKKMILTKSCYREGYYRKKLKKFVCFRHWRRVSPLQAAALSLDNFLVLDLLSYINDNVVLRLQAAQQLQEVLNRKEDKHTFTDAAMTGTVSIDKTREKKVEVEALRCEKAEAYSADLSSYQAPFKTLLKAYNDYCIQFDTLYEAGNRDALYKLWGKIGECHKRLSRYGLQEFFSDISFDPVPSFTTSPNRRECRYWNGLLFDLDQIGLNTDGGLCKGRVQTWAQWAVIVGGACVFVGEHSMRTARRPIELVLRRIALVDLAAITRLCELRQAELENIVSCLFKPGATITLTPGDKCKCAVKPS